MRRNRVLIILALAILSGALAGYSALRFLQERPTRLVAAETGREQLIAVAARDLAMGAVVGEEDVKLVEWPGDALPEGYARSVPEVLGRGLIQSVKMNEPLLEAKMADIAAGGGLPIVIPEGMRAVSVRVNDVIGVAGFVVPGTRVDVMLTVEDGGAPITKVILQNIPALAAGQQYQRDEEGNPISVTVMTVLVTPEDAEKLVHAASQGSIQMALRNTLDLEDIETEGSRVAELLTGARSSRPRGPTVSRSTSGGEVIPTSGIIEVYKGGVKTLISY